MEEKGPKKRVVLGKNSESPWANCIRGQGRAIGGTCENDEIVENFVEVFAKQPVRIARIVGITAENTLESFSHKGLGVDWVVGCGIIYR